MQSPVSDFLTHNAPINLEWGHKRVYATVGDNIITQQDSIMANVALVIEDCQLFQFSNNQYSTADEWYFKIQ